jgi:hypothetical protein
MLPKILKSQAQKPVLPFLMPINTATSAVTGKTKNE